MLSQVLFAAVALVSISLCHSCITWHRHILAARATGLPVVVVPFHDTNELWRLLQGPGMMVLRMLPAWCTHPWIEVVSPLQSWHNKYAAYKELGSDAYITVAPGGLMLWTADPALIADITQRNADFPKPIQAYGVLNLYGQNVVTLEGQSWRHHRRIVAPSFGEQNNRLVWEESLIQAEHLIDKWSHGSPVPTLREDVMRLSLYVISKAGFGKSDAATEAPPGHRLSFAAAMAALTENLMLIIVLSPKLLRWLPLHGAYEAYAEWRQYMIDLYTDKKEHLGRDLMSSMVRASKADAQLSRDEVMGNAFIFMFAGHETTANSLYFALIYLAQNISTQRRIQVEVDSIFADRQPSQWSYDDLPALLNGRIGASLNEVLRLVPPVPDIPKTTQTPQMITVNGKSYTIPAGVFVLLSVASASHHPSYWPGDDVNEFNPERWMHGSASDGLPFKPAKGAFFPWSEGHRSCLGRRFSQVEYAAAMAVILQRYSVELDVPDSDERVAQMGIDERRTVWEHAHSAAQKTLESQMTAVVTLRLKSGANIPVRFTERGQERFDF